MSAIITVSRSGHGELMVGDSLIVERSVMKVVRVTGDELTLRKSTAWDWMRYECSLLMWRAIDACREALAELGDLWTDLRR